MTNQELVDINSLSNLITLQKIRIRSYEKAMEKDKQSYIKASESVNNRIEEITAIKIEHVDINDYATQYQVGRSPVKREYAHIRRFWLNYDLEMHEYYLEQERNTLTEAKDRYEQTKSMWLKEKFKSQKLKEEYRRALNLRDLNIENINEELSQDDQSSIRK